MDQQMVPEWDGGNCRDSLDLIWGSPDTLSPSKGRWDTGQPIKIPDHGFVPDRDFEELCWEDGQLLVVMQDLGTTTSKGNIRVQNDADQFAPVDEIAPVQSEVDGTMITNLNNGVSIYPSSMNLNPQEDELLAWLQYPLDEPEILPNSVPSFERVSRSGLISHDANKDVTLINLEEAYVAGLTSSIRRWDNTFVSMPMTASVQKPPIYSTENKEAIDDSSMLTVSTDILPSVVRADISSSAKEEILPLIKADILPLVKADILPLDITSNELESSMNFSNFARPAATFKANLHSLGIASGPTGAKRLKNLNRMAAVDASKPESIDSSKKTHVSQIVPNFNASVAHNHPSGYFSSWNEAKYRATADERFDGSSELVGRTNGWNSSIIGSVCVPDVVEAVEPSDTLSSIGSEDVDLDEKRASGRRKAYDEELEIQSKALESETASIKKLGTAGEVNINKKRRIAESHNQSERRRRDRISEKMKALQSLVPNSHKSDKASMLDEVITYIKALKAQIKMISCNNGGGYFLSPMLLPQGMQPVTMASWPPSITMGMGVNMGMTGVNMGISSPTMTSTSRRQYPQLQPIPSVHTTQTNNTGTIPSAKFNVIAQETLKAAAVSPVYPVIVPAATHGSMRACNPVPMQRLQKPVQVLTAGAYDNGSPHNHQHHYPSTFMARGGLLHK